MSKSCGGAVVVVVGAATAATVVTGTASLGSLVHAAPSKGEYHGRDDREAKVVGHSLDGNDDQRIFAEAGVIGRRVERPDYDPE